MKENYDSKKIKSLLKETLSKKKCEKHPIAAVIETVDSLYIQGYNGPPEGIEHPECLREGYASGKGMELCPGIHAERRAIAHAARDGIKLKGGTIYLNEWFPCADCAVIIIEAGLFRLVTPDEFYSDRKSYTLIPKLQKQPYNFEMAEKLMREAGIEIIVDSEIRPWKKKL